MGKVKLRKVTGVKRVRWTVVSGGGGGLGNASQRVRVKSLQIRCCIREEEAWGMEC